MNEKEILEDRYIKPSDTGDGSAAHKLRASYFRKLFGRIPKLSDMDAYLLMDKVYSFQFDRWAEGKKYTPFSKKSKPKMLEWVNRKLAQQQ